MNTIAWLFILGGILIARSVARGRVLYLGQDLGDAFLAIASGDADALAGVLAREGEGVTPDKAEMEASVNAQTGMGSNVSLASTAVRLGKAAKGYRWASSGPDYYDCSGLVWKACRTTGAYKGSRFTTSSFATMAGKSFTRVTNAKVNDIVVWLPKVGTGHMGVVTGDDQFYSARSVRSGIGYASISGWGNGKTKPQFYRLGTLDELFPMGPRQP